jgi:hypothetical protein
VKRVIGLLIPLLIGLALARGALADTTVPFDLTFPDTQATTNPCDSAAVLLVGQEHLSGQIVIGPDGVKLVKIHSNAHYDGSGTDGSSYVSNQTNDSEYHFGPSDEIIITSTYVLISTSPMHPNFILVVTDHIDTDGGTSAHGTGAKCTG